MSDKEVKLNYGINEDVSNEDYHADREFFSSSVLKDLLKSREAFYKKYILKEEQEERAERAAFSFGSYIHSLILEPHLITKEYEFFDGAGRNSLKYKQFKKQHVGKTIILEREVEKAKKLIKAYNSRPEAVALIRGGVAEQTLCVDLYGIPIKVRADYVNHEKGYIVDVKTTSSGTDVNGVRDSCDKWGYMLSAALYSMAFKEHYGKDFTFYWIFLGKFDNQCEVYKMSLDSMRNGIQEVKDALRIYRMNEENDSWLNYQIEEI